jgi:hypothetical protein
MTSYDKTTKKEQHKKKYVSLTTKISVEFYTKQLYVDRIKEV